MLERATDVMLATHRWQITIADVVEAILIAYRELGVPMSADAKLHSSRRTAGKNRITAL